MTAEMLLRDPPALPRGDAQSLDVFFAPRTVAIFGAGEEPGSVGRALLTNLIHNPFGGVLFPISPRRSVLGIEASPRLAVVPEAIELAIVLSPPAEVAGVLDQCDAAGVKAALVLSDGDELISLCRAKRRSGSMRILGPGSHGIACPRTGFNATLVPDGIRPGNVGLLSQDGDLLTASIGLEHREYAGCSAFVSLGGAADVGWAEWLAYLDADPQTECIGIYLETLDDPRTFFAALRNAAARKPVLLIKSGDMATSARGSPRDEVFDEACRSHGVLRVRRVTDLFRMAHLLTTQPPAQGRRLTILTNAHGPGVLAADRLHASGGEPARLAPETVAALRPLLPASWNRQNPIDLGPSATETQFMRVAAIASRDPGSDALLVLLAPQFSIDPVRAAEELSRALPRREKPVLACWLWGAANRQSLAVLHEADLPVFGSPEAAVNAFDDLCRHTENQRYLAEVTAALAEPREQEHPLSRLKPR